LHDLDDIVIAGGAVAGADWIFHSGVKLLKCKVAERLQLMQDACFSPLACKLL